MCVSKTCFKCGLTQPLSNFYPHPRMADGHLGKCKECTKKDVQENRKEKIEKYRQYDKDRSKNPDRIELAKEMNKRWRAEDSRRTRCHSAVARAVRAGVLTKMPCSVCGSDKSLAHHESYDVPLGVTWLCQIHHKERHKQLAILGIDP